MFLYGIVWTVIMFSVALLYLFVCVCVLIDCSHIQAVSCDEAYFELRVPSYAAADEKVRRMREEIAAATGCNASAGLGPNMLVARLATKKAKPNGQRCVPPDRVPSFMAALDVGAIPGVGHAIAYSLELLRVKTVGDLLGKVRAALFYFARTEHSA